MSPTVAATHRLRSLRASYHHPYRRPRSTALVSDAAASPSPGRARPLSRPRRRVRATRGAGRGCGSGQPAPLSWTSQPAVARLSRGLAPRFSRRPAPPREPPAPSPTGPPSPAPVPWWAAGTRDARRAPLGGEPERRRLFSLRHQAPIAPQ